MIMCNSYLEAKMEAINILSNWDNYIMNLEIYYDFNEKWWVIDYEENDDFREIDS